MPNPREDYASLISTLEGGTEGAAQRAARRGGTGAGGGWVRPGSHVLNTGGVSGRTVGGGIGGGGPTQPWTTPESGGAASPRASPQAEALANPTPIVGSTPLDPSQAGATTGWEQYTKELSAGTAAETERELQRYRDELSTGLASEGEAAIARGADPSLFRSRALESGKRGLLELQGRLADVSLGRRAEALGGLTTAAGAGAAERRMLHLGTLAAQQEAQRTLIAQA